MDAPYVQQSTGPEIAVGVRGEMRFFIKNNV
jgi:hypothetical protein